MKKLHPNMVLFSLLILTFLFSCTNDGHRSVKIGWKAGIAREIITPDENMWMAGYASRTHPSEGTLQDLWVKVIVFEDSTGHRAVLVTTDVLGFPKELSDRIRDRLKAKYGLARNQIILNSSHTHTGPVLDHSLIDMYPLNEQEYKKIVLYSKKL